MRTHARGGPRTDGADDLAARAHSEEWLRLARRARTLSWITLGWLGVEAGVAVGAAIVSSSVALLGFGLDSGVEALASVIVVWRFSGTRLHSKLSERRAQQLVAVSFFLLAPYVAVEAALALSGGDRPETTIIGIALTAGTALLEPPLGVAKRRLGARLGSRATSGEGVQNLLCAYLAVAVLAGLLANTLLGIWWLDGAVAIGIAGWALIEGRSAWRGIATCSCAAPACLDPQDTPEPRRTWTDLTDHPTSGPQQRSCDGRKPLSRVDVTVDSVEQSPASPS